MSDGGTYTLVIERTSGGPIEVGALGALEFPEGWYAYTGSALGSGGFSRIERHERVDAGEHDVRHWHVDYLLGAPDARIDHVIQSAGVDIECAVARALCGSRVADFGCSDCGCRSHLAYHPDRATLLDSVDRAHRQYR
jgi:endonuclease-3